jgi:hypothetical protein
MVNNYKVIGKIFPLLGEFFTFLMAGSGVKDGMYWQIKEKIESL